MKNKIEKFPFRSNSYDINIVINYIVETRISALTQFALKDKYNIPAGTIGTWYAQKNELRILFALFNKKNEEIEAFFKNYSRDEIKKFIQNVKEQVEQDIEIDDTIKKIYIRKIDDYIIYSNNNKDEEDIAKQHKEQKEIYENYEKIQAIMQTSEIQEAFVKSNQEKINKFILNNPQILDKLMSELYK